MGINGVANKIIESMTKAGEGMNNLMKTYAQDAVIVCALEVLHDKNNELYK